MIREKQLKDMLAKNAISSNKESINGPYKKRQPKGKGTLCWKCQKSLGRCTWSADFEPVVGWEAEATIISNPDETQHSFRVIRCPEFFSDKIGSQIYNK